MIIIAKQIAADAARLPDFRLEKTWAGHKRAFAVRGLRTVAARQQRGPATGARIVHAALVGGYIWLTGVTSMLLAGVTV